MSISNSAKIVANCENENNSDGYGLLSRQDIEIGGSNITATGGEHGISCENLTINAGAVVRSVGAENGIWVVHHVYFGSNAKAEVFNNYQDIEIKINGQKIYQAELDSGCQIKASFVMPESKMLSVSILLPNAISPFELGQNTDARKLGIQLVNLKIEQ